MSLTEVAHLSREQLLQREKQLQGQLALQRVRPSAPLAAVAAPFRFSHRAQQAYGAVYRCTFPIRSAAPQVPTLNTVVRQPAANVRHSHNRVFVRKKRPAPASTADVAIIAPTLQGRLSPAGSLASVSSSVSSLKEGHDETPSSTTSSAISSPQSVPSSSSSSSAAAAAAPPPAATTTSSALDTAVVQISPIHTPTPPDEAPSWARVEPRLVVVPLGGNSSDDSAEEDDIAVRAHSEALRRILHPVKQSAKQPFAGNSQSSSQSIVFQTATKLVKHGALQRPSVAAVLNAAAAASSRHKKIDGFQIGNILTSCSSNSGGGGGNNSLKINKLNPHHHHHARHSILINHNKNNTSITSGSSTSYLSGRSTKKQPIIVDRTGSAVCRQQQPSTSTSAVSSHITATTTSSPRKRLRQVSKFKLITIPSGRSPKLASIISPGSKSFVLKRHSAATHVAPAFGSPAAHRLVVKASPSSAKKLLAYQTRFKFTRGIPASSSLKQARAGLPMSAMSAANGRISKRSSTSLQKLLMLGGVPFQTSKGGKVLKRINTTLHRKSPNTSAAGVGLQQSIRRFKTQRGSPGLVRQVVGRSTTAESIVKHAVASQLVSRSIFKLNNKKRLQTTSSPSGQKGKDCLFYIRFGKCHRGDACKFAHDPAKVSICTRFLKGTCKLSTCPFSHEVSADRMPLCSYFQRGQCTAQACPYRHAYFRKDVPYCHDFLHSFCNKGEKCTKQHVLVCVDPECSRDPKKCPLRHKKSKSKENSSGKTPQRRRKRKRVVLVSKSISKEAWPEFVTLTGEQNTSVLGDPGEDADDVVDGGGGDDDDDEVQMEMPSRAQSRRLKRFLERRARPVWPDYSSGVSSVRLETRQLTRMTGHRLRQLIKKARWMRRVPRPVRIPGEFISLIMTDDQACDSDDAYPRTELPVRYTEKSLKGHWSGLSGDEVSETEDDMLLELTYGDAITLARRREGSVASELSVSSYTSPESDYSSDDEALADAANRATTKVEENDWLLDYLYSLEKSPSPPPEPERLDNYGPIYEHWEFQIGDKIREAIHRFKRRRRRHMKREERKRGVSLSAPKRSEFIAEDYIPLWAQEEGEILSEDEVEGVDLDIVDMELDSDAEVGPCAQGLLRCSPIEAEEISSDEDGLALASEDESANEGRPSLKQGATVHINGAEAISDVEDISDVEEGEVF